MKSRQPQPSVRPHTLYCIDCKSPQIFFMTNEELWNFNSPLAMCDCGKITKFIKKLNGE